MNYYVFSTKNFNDKEEEPTWEFVQQFGDLSEAEAFTRGENGDEGVIFRCVPAATEEDARAHIEMPNQPF